MDKELLETGKEKPKSTEKKAKNIYRQSTETEI